MLHKGPDISYDVSWKSHLFSALVLALICSFGVQVAGLQVGPEHNTHFEGLFKVWITQLSTILPAGTNIPAAYERGSDQDQDFVQNLAIFLTTFFRVLPLMNISCMLHENF